MFRRVMYAGSLLLLGVLVLSTVAGAILVCNKGSASLNAPAAVRAQGESDIIQGGVALLSAFSSTSEMFSNVEAASAPTGKARLVSAEISGEDAVKYLKIAEDKYADLVRMFNKYGTTAEASGKLKHFDYDTLGKQDRMEDSEVWSLVTQRLQTGHVELVFQYMYDQIRSLRSQVEPVVYKLHKGESPDLSAYMKVMRQWTDLTSFGQYSAVVFKKL